MTTPPAVALRRGVLAASVLHDVVLRAADAGVVLTGPPDLFCDWAELRAAVDGADPESRAGVERLVRHLRARRRLAVPPPVAVRPYAVPRDFPLHPGPGWGLETVLGGVLDVGLGMAGLDPQDPERVLPLPPVAARCAGLDLPAERAAALRYLDAMAQLAVARLARDPTAPLRPVGECDVITLLAAPAYRSALVAGPARGLRTAAVPMRDRGWLDLRRVDPTFVVAAAAATDIRRRGFSRPLLITADEVTVGLRSA